jgi:hypothetical protein
MFSLFQQLKNHKASLSYFGVFDDALTEQLIKLSEYYLQNFSDLHKLKKRVPFLIAECFQNVVRHGASEGDSDIDKPHSVDFFQMNILEDRVVMTSCNLVPNSIMEELRKKITDINSMDADTLRNFYFNVLSNTGLSSKGGAGLGLIEMARKSARPIQYYFFPVDENYSRFFLTIETYPDKVERPKKTDMAVMNELYTELTAEKKLIVYKGDFSDDIIIPLIEMLEHNIHELGNNKSRDKKTVGTLIEMLQNISQHGKKTGNQRDGIFSLSTIDKTCIIESGNIATQDKYIALSNYLSQINKLETQEITPLYRKWLDSPTQLSGLGLLEMARNSENNLEYEFKKLPEDEYFYSIKVKV